MIDVEPPNPVIGFLETYGFFTFLAYLLAFIVLYYIFRELLEKHVKRPRDAGNRQIVALILSILVTVLLYILLSPFASSAATYVATAVFVIIFLFVVIVIVARLLGLDIISELQGSSS